MLILLIAAVLALAGVVVLWQVTETADDYNHREWRRHWGSL
jgi:hypothetical protein